MNRPDILYYARMVNTTTPEMKSTKYTITEQTGFYPPIEELRGKDGKISMYLMEKLKEGFHVPSVRLQAKNSLNLTGLKDYYDNGKLSGFAYGYPFAEETYSKKKRPNPFYKYSQDGFLFITHQDTDKPDSVTPTCIELLVLKGAKVVIGGYCKQLALGGFDDELRRLREQAAKSENYI